MWPNPQETADLVTFTENILNGKLHILCSVCCAIPVFSHQYISTQKEDDLTLNERTELNEWTNWIERTYFQLLKTTESDSNIAMNNQLLENVCRSVITKFWKFPKIVNVMFLRKFKKPILPFQITGFILVFFCLCFSCVHYFSFALLTIIRTTKRQRTRINKVSKINKIICYSYDIMTKTRYDAILNLPKNHLVWSYLGVTLLTCNIQDSFCFTYKYLYFRKLNLFCVDDDWSD